MMDFDGFCKNIDSFAKVSILVQMKNPDKRKEQILELVRNTGIVTTAEVRSHGIHHEYLRQLRAEGKLVQLGRGRYMLPDAEVTANHSLALTAKAIPARYGEKI